MAKPQVNLLEQLPPEHQQSLPPSNENRPGWRRRLFGGMSIIGGIIAVFFVVNVVIPSIRLSASFGSNDGFLTQLKHLTFGGDKDLSGEQSDRINVLLLGIGGEGHDGPLLTDTIIIASIEPSTGKAALMSLPRDLNIPYPDGSWRKINEAYVQGERTSPGNGLEEAANTIASVVGVPLPYYTLIDFHGFEKVIDQVGGVHVNVERSFTDPLFPTQDEKTQSVTFAAGWQWMNGEQALTFARSRHGNNGEGSDFARAKRQQKIILALKDRMLSSSVLLNPVAVNRIASQLSDNIQTNIEPWELLKLYGYAKDINPEQVVRLTPDNGPNGILADATRSDGAYILMPKGGNFDQLQTLARDVFSGKELVQEPALVEIRNGTTVAGLAAKTASDLESRGYRVVSVANAPERNATETVIYDYTNGRKPTSLAALKIMLNARVVPGVPAWLVPSASSFDPNIGDYQAPTTKSKADFLIIIGSNASASLPNKLGTVN